MATDHPPPKGVTTKKLVWMAVWILATSAALAQSWLVEDQDPRDDAAQEIRDTATAAGVPSAHGVTLRNWLGRLARVAQLYQDTALGFACKETIEWRDTRATASSARSGREKFSYIFIEGENGLENFRTYTGWTTSASRARAVTPRAPVYLHSALSWIMIFEESRQKLHRYSLDGEDTILGRPAVKIVFEPIPPVRERINDWYGVAWVDRETSQFLKVEAYESEDFLVKSSFEAQIAAGTQEKQDYEFRRFVTDYTVVKNGMRFPGIVDIRLLRYKVRPSEERLRWIERTLLKVTHEYRAYKFFSVRTAEEIRRFTAGDSETNR